MPLILDSNLLVLSAVGSAGESYIDKHRALRHEYNVEDYKRIVELMRYFPEHVFVPHVLAESFALVRQIGEPLKSVLTIHFGKLVNAVSEEHIQSTKAVGRPEFSGLGLTDSVLLALAEIGASLLTVDLKLYLAASSAGYSACNYNHVRDHDPSFNPWASRG